MCKHCGNEIVGRRRNVMYCSVKCKNNAGDLKRRGRTRTDSQKAKARDAYLSKTYGIGSSEWEALFESQDRACAICKSEQTSGKGWHTDHCHENGNVRGILCHDCNIMLGHAKDKVDTLLAAVEYLR